MSRHDQRYFRITVGAVLDASWNERFSPLLVHANSNGTTTLEGILEDQAALHGIFRLLQGFGLGILEVLSESTTAKANPKS